MPIIQATNQSEWDSFLLSQPYHPFLQSWTMGEVYRSLGQTPFRLELREGSRITGICSAILVPARRGRHLAVSYGPLLEHDTDLPLMLEELSRIAREQKCSFIRMSPFWENTKEHLLSEQHLVPSPLHLLGEHLWVLRLTDRKEEEILMQMRKTTRNLIRRAEKEGVTIEASANPTEDLQHFITLHDETRKRHGFTPYTNAFFREQVRQFAPRKECTLYLAWYQNEVIATSIHMHVGGETSYHHGASTQKYRTIPASYLLQWRAIQDAFRRGDHLYNFWGIAPGQLTDEGYKVSDTKHPFAGVTTFKTGFGGELLPLVHCHDLPLAPGYRITKLFEQLRKWKRGF